MDWAKEEVDCMFRSRFGPECRSNRPLCFALRVWDSCVCCGGSTQSNVWARIHRFNKWPPCFGLSLGFLLSVGLITAVAYLYLPTSRVRIYIECFLYLFVYLLLIRSLGDNKTFWRRLLWLKALGFWFVVMKREKIMIRNCSTIKTQPWW